MSLEAHFSTTVEYWQEFLYCLFGNRRIADPKDEDALTVALANKMKEVVSQIQLDRDNALEWVKENLLEKLYKKSFKQDADYEALKLCHAIQVFVNREILPKLLEGSKIPEPKGWHRDSRKFSIMKKEGSACDSKKETKP